VTPKSAANLITSDEPEPAPLCASEPSNGAGWMFAGNGRPPMRAS
jgi:hypothetical protein